MDAKGIKPNRRPGISFVVRCRNEEAYLKDCLASLKGLEVPHEIVVILHRCTDRSKAIASEAKANGQPIVIVEHDQPISRAGYETLITPADHPASLVSFYDFSFSWANFRWTFKWDADFSCSPELKDFINHRLDIGLSQPTAYRIGCALGDDGPVNAELYLTNALAGFSKHIFWEVPSYAEAFQEIRLDNESIHSISNRIIKDYWRAPSWFLNPNSKDESLAVKYAKAVEILGPEPPGMATASNPACDDKYRLVVQNEARLGACGVQLYA